MGEDSRGAVYDRTKTTCGEVDRNDDDSRGTVDMKPKPLVRLMVRIELIGQCKLWRIKDHHIGVMSRNMRAVQALHVKIHLV